MGNNVSCEVKGIGSVKIKMWDGSVKTLTRVRHIPNLKRNLVSLGMLDTNGCSYKSQGGILKVFKGIVVVMKDILQQSLYVLQERSILGESVVSVHTGDKI